MTWKRVSIPPQFRNTYTHHIPSCLDAQWLRVFTANHSAHLVSALSDGDLCDWNTLRFNTSGCDFSVVGINFLPGERGGGAGEGILLK